MVLFFSKAKSWVESIQKDKTNQTNPATFVYSGERHVHKCNHLHSVSYIYPIWPRLFVLNHLIESHTLQEIPVRPDAVIVPEIFSCRATFIQFSQDVRCFVWRYCTLYCFQHYLSCLSTPSAVQHHCPRAHVITRRLFLVLIDLQMIRWHESSTLCPPNHNKGVSALSAQWFGGKQINSPYLRHC